MFFLGSGSPPICVVVFSSLQDKDSVMYNKVLLKGLTNRDDRPIFINDYYPAQQNQQRKYEKQLVYDNSVRPEKDQTQMDFRKGKLYVKNLPLHQARPVKTPGPTDLLDLDCNELTEIMNLKTQRGSEILIKDSKFIGYTMPVMSCEDVQKIYIKIKLLHPSAQHVICAYCLPDCEENLFTKQKTFLMTANMEQEKP